MLRITCASAPSATRTVKIEGRITGEYVPELARAVTRAVGGAPRVVLDMSDVTFVDQAGATLLRQFRQQGVELVECSTFISTLVNGAAQ